MSYLKGRIKKLEERLEVGEQKRDPLNITVIVPDDDDRRESLGRPAETWITYQEQVEAAKKAHAKAAEKDPESFISVTMVKLSVEKELQAREQRRETA